MIPKVIHYCWFGKNEKSDAVKKCIDSWRRYCPDFEIVEWNEDNFDVECIPFTRDAYKAKKWAFVSDYARLKIIYENGGIYLDTDVELLKPLDEFLSFEGFAGFEGDKLVATGLGFGAVKGHEIIGEIMRDYHSVEIPSESGKYVDIACPVLNTRVLKRHGLVCDGSMQTVGGIRIFPREYFNPKDAETYVTKITENTVAIHHYDASWRAAPGALKQKIIRMIVAILGEKGFFKLKSALKSMVKGK